MAWCESNRVDYIFGLARNDRLVGKIAGELGRLRRCPKSAVDQRGALKNSKDYAQELESADAV